MTDMNCENNKITAYKGDTIDGILVELLVNGAPQSLAYTEITATFSYEPQISVSTFKESIPEDKIFTIGDGIDDIQESLGKYILLKDKLIDWEKGKWNFKVKYEFPDDRIKTWTFGELWIV